MKQLMLCACGLLVMLVASAAQGQVKYSQQWNMCNANMGGDAGVKEFIALMKQSKDCGCTHILVGDSAWLRIADNPQYLARVAEVKKAAKEMGVTLVPSVFAFGYSGRYLGFNPNLGAGLPVKNMPFVVKGKTAAPDPTPILDAATFMSKVENGEYQQEMKLPQFMYYKVTLRTSAYPFSKDPDGQDEKEPFRAAGHVGDGMRWLSRTNTHMEQKGDEWVSTNTFNTLDSDSVLFRVKVADLKLVKDVKIELAGPLFILRRDNLKQDMTPLKVTSEDGKTVYEEGKDFKRLVDPQIAAGSGDYDQEKSHYNNIELTDDSRIKDGQKILVSFFHSYKIYADQNSITLEDPAVWEIMQKDVDGCAKVWNTGHYFMNFDEIRICGWENQSVTPGKTLADLTKRGYDMIRAADSKSVIYTWSDMYAPQQNAWPAGWTNAKGEKMPANYYLLHGTWGGAEEGLPKDVVVCNWISSPDGLKFFADRGHSQVLCGYYDQTTTAGMKTNITRWKKDSAGVKNILGFMYTQWGSGFGHMKEYFELVGSYDQWGGK